MKDATRPPNRQPFRSYTTSCERPLLSGAANALSFCCATGNTTDSPTDKNARQPQGGFPCIATPWAHVRDRAPRPSQTATANADRVECSTHGKVALGSSGTLSSGVSGPLTREKTARRPPQNLHNRSTTRPKRCWNGAARRRERSGLCDPEGLLPRRADLGTPTELNAHAVARNLWLGHPPPQGGLHVSRDAALPEGRTLGIIIRTKDKDAADPGLRPTASQCAGAKAERFWERKR